MPPRIVALCRAAAVFVLLAAVAVGPAVAGQGAAPLVSDRPDFTESAETIAAGRVQVEGGASRTSSEAGDETALGELLARIGLTDRLELRLEPGSFEIVDAPGGGEVEGLGDASVGVKVRLPRIAAAGAPLAALIVDAELPTGAERVGEEGMRPGAVLALAWELRDGLGLGANLGWRRARADGERFDQASGSLALGWEAAPRTGVFLEWFGFSRDAPGGDPLHHLDGGFTFAVTPDLQLDLYGGVGLGGDAPEHFVGAGFAARF
jgi:hypothetical protein